MAQQFHKLKLQDKIHETEDSASFIFEVPEDLTEQFAYRAGQYLTLKVNINGQEERRAYSIYKAPSEPELGVTIKRLKGGKVSNYLIDKLSVGDTIEVMAPEGRFVVKADQAEQRDHYFFAGGSGITPVMSMIKTILEEEPLSSCYLLYANRNENAIIFKEVLDDMILKYEGQFYLKYIVSQPHQEKASGLSGLFGKKAQPSWRGLKGRINSDILNKYMDDHPSKTNKQIYYLCGPGGMTSTVENWLVEKGAESVQIKKEYFTVDTTAAAAVATGGSNSSTVEVKLSGTTFTVQVPAGKTILDALIEAEKDPPYSCTSGACSTCVAKVLDGQADMEVCFALDDDEIKDGYVLTCQATCSTPTVSIDYDA